MIGVIAAGTAALAAGVPVLLWICSGLAAVVLAGAALWRLRARRGAGREACAVILAVLCEELRAAPEELRIIRICKL